MSRQQRRSAAPAGRTHQCPHCPESFADQEDCEIHVFTVHFDQHQVPVARHDHVCPNCGASFQHLDELQAHSLMLHSENYADITDMLDDREGVPSRTFEQRFDVGPTADQFAPFAPEKVKAMLTERLRQRIMKQRDLPKPRCDSGILGEHRGAAGCRNSCYFDCLMMIMALFTQFDGIYSQEALNQSELLRIILFEVVIPLRTMMFVSRDVIAMLRYYLAGKTGNQGYLEGIQDFDEFANELLETIDTRTVCDIRHDGSMDAKLTFPISADKPFGSLQAGLDDCLRAKKVSVEQPPSAFFVRVRPEFKVRPLALPQMVLNVFGEVYELSAIPCIEAAHYMCFLRFPNGEWVFFDSMHGFDNGHRIPTMTYVPGFRAYIISGCDERLLSVKSDAREGETRHSFHDLVTKYAYTCLYTRNTVSAQAVSAQAVSSEVPDCLAQARQIYQANAQQLAAVEGGAAAVSSTHLTEPRLPRRIVRVDTEEFREFSAGGGAAAVPVVAVQSSDSSRSLLRSVEPVPNLPEVPGDELCLNFSIPTTLFDEVSRVVQRLYRWNGRPSVFVLTGMTLFASFMDQERVLYIGSFPVNYSRWCSVQYRAVEFIFEDGTTVKFDGDVSTLVNPEVKQAFKDEVMSKGDVAITSIVFANIPN